MFQRVYGCVASVEDHGYVVDIGVNGVHAFLKHDNAERFIQLHNDGEIDSLFFVMDYGF